MESEETERDPTTISSDFSWSTHSSESAAEDTAKDSFQTLEKYQSFSFSPPCVGWIVRMIMLKLDCSLKILLKIL